MLESQRAELAAHTASTVSLGMTLSRIEHRVAQLTADAADLPAVTAELELANVARHAGGAEDVEPAVERSGSAGQAARPLPVWLGAAPPQPSSVTDSRIQSSSSARCGPARATSSPPPRY